MSGDGCDAASAHVDSQPEVCAKPSEMTDAHLPISPPGTGGNSPPADDCAAGVFASVQCGDVGMADVASLECDANLTTADAAPTFLESTPIDVPAVESDGTSMEGVDANDFTRCGESAPTDAPPAVPESASDTKKRRRSAPKKEEADVAEERRFKSARLGRAAAAPKDEPTDTKGESDALDPSLTEAQRTLAQHLLVLHKDIARRDEYMLFFVDGDDSDSAPAPETACVDAAQCDANSEAPVLCALSTDAAEGPSPMEIDPAPAVASDGASNVEQSGEACVQTAEPIDLMDIRRRILRGHYATVEAYGAELDRVCERYIENPSEAIRVPRAKRLRSDYAKLVVRLAKRLAPKEAQRPASKYAFETETSPDADVDADESATDADRPAQPEHVWTVDEVHPFVYGALVLAAVPCADDASVSEWIPGVLTYEPTTGRFARKSATNAQEDVDAGTAKGRSNRRNKRTVDETAAPPKPPTPSEYHVQLLGGGRGRSRAWVPTSSLLRYGVDENPLLPKREVACESVNNAQLAATESGEQAHCEVTGAVAMDTDAAGEHSAHGVAERSADGSAHKDVQMGMKEETREQTDARAEEAQTALPAGESHALVADPAQTVEQQPVAYDVTASAAESLESKDASANEDASAADPSASTTVDATEGKGKRKSKAAAQPPAPLPTYEGLADDVAARLRIADQLARCGIRKRIQVVVACLQAGAFECDDSSRTLAVLAAAIAAVERAAEAMAAPVGTKHRRPRPPPPGFDPLMPQALVRTAFLAAVQALGDARPTVTVTDDVTLPWEGENDDDASAAEQPAKRKSSSGKTPSRFYFYVTEEVDDGKRCDSNTHEEADSYVPRTRSRRSVSSASPVAAKPKAEAPAAGTPAVAQSSRKSTDGSPKRGAKRARAENSGAEENEGSPATAGRKRTRTADGDATAASRSKKATPKATSPKSATEKNKKRERESEEEDTPKRSRASPKSIEKSSPAAQKHSGRTATKANKESGKAKSAADAPAKSKGRRSGGESAGKAPADAVSDGEDDDADSPNHEPICYVCEQPGSLLCCEATCFRSVHVWCAGLWAVPGLFECDDCQTGVRTCLFCARAGATRACASPRCGHAFHDQCLRTLPLARFEPNDKVFCPLHMCATCRRPCKGERVARCTRCPIAYHSNKDCQPLGVTWLEDHRFICVRHILADQCQSVARSNNTCKECGDGGDLACCDGCPNAFHEECLGPDDPPLSDGQWFCRSCVAGARPVAGDVVWVKFGQFKWWPAEIIADDAIPPTLAKRASQAAGRVPIVFYGTHEVAWAEDKFVVPWRDRPQDVNKATRADTLKPSAYNRALIEGLKAAGEMDERRLQNASRGGRERPPKYQHLKTNLYVNGRPPRDDEEVPQCACTAASGKNCGADCLNRILCIECSPRNCKAGEACRNRRFQRREYAAGEVFRTEGGRGWGFRATKPIAAGDFVVEYVGEVISVKECQERLRKDAEAGLKDYYFLSVTTTDVIDARRKANHARFINHSCDPNCMTQKWTVLGETRVGIFAVRDIAPGTELTFDYQFECIGNAEVVRCACGARNCSGFLGVRPTKNDEGAPAKKKKARKPRRSRGNTHDDECFVCGGDGRLVLCDKPDCTRVYHADCVGSTAEALRGKWVCPWHHCDACGANSTSLCSTCPTSFCTAHADGKIDSAGRCEECAAAPPAAEASTQETDAVMAQDETASAVPVPVSENARS